MGLSSSPYGPVALFGAALALSGCKYKKAITPEECVELAEETEIEDANFHDAAVLTCHDSTEEVDTPNDECDALYRCDADGNTITVSFDINDITSDTKLDVAQDEIALIGVWDCDYGIGGFIKPAEFRYENSGPTVDGYKHLVSNTIYTGCESDDVVNLNLYIVNTSSCSTVYGKWNISAGNASGDPHKAEVSVEFYSETGVYRESGYPSLICN